MLGYAFTRLTEGEVAAAAGAGAAFVILWFLLRPRPPVVTVSSHVLWDTVLPRRRDPLIKELIQLLLQLLAVVAIAVALGDPRPLPDGEALTVAPDQRIWVVDRSISMGADAGQGARIARVAALLQEELVGLPEGVDVGLIGAAESPELLAPCGEDRQRLRLALRMLDVAGVRADLAAALGLAVAQSDLRPDQAVVELWTDDPDAGALAERFAQDRGWDVRVRAPFAPLPNVAITAFDLRASEGIPAEEEAVVRIRNHSPWPAELVLSLETADAVLGEATVALEPGAEALRRYRFQPLDVAGVEAVLRDVRFESPDGPVGDALAADDRAFGWLQPVRPLSAVLVSDGNRYLERVLALLPGVHLTKVTPAAWGRRARAAAEAADIVFLDGFLPPGRALPRVFYVAPPPGGAFDVRASVDDPQITDWSPDHPLFGGLVLRDLTIAVGELFDERPGDVRLVGTPGGALALARDEGPGRRSIAWGFDFGQSDLPLRLAFPQIIVNAMLWMREGRAAGAPPGGRHPVTAALWMGPDGPSDAVATEEPDGPIDEVATEGPDGPSDAVATEGPDGPSDAVATEGPDGPSDAVATPRTGLVRLTDLRRAQAAIATGDERGAERATRELALSAGLHPIRFPAPGLYRLEGAGWQRDLAVNLPQVQESNLQGLPFSDDRPVAVPPPEAPVEDPSMPWLILGLIAGGALITEFGLYTR